MSTPVDVESADHRAVAAILDHHEELSRELGDRLRSLRTAVREQAAYHRRLTPLTEFIQGSVLPHAAAEEMTLYPAAATDPATALLVDAMTAEHRALTEQAGTLAGSRSAIDALAAAERFAAVFAVHVGKENELLLPALARNPEVSLAALLRAMHQHLTELPAADGTTNDADGRDDETPEELDVRTLPHGGGRHDVIFARLDALRPGRRFVIVNDHDPRPLRFRLDAAWPGAFSWDYLEAGPQLWRIAITRRL